MTRCTTYIHAFTHLYIVRMHMLCKLYFVRIVVDLFVGPFNCLNFSLELCVCVCGGGGGGDEGGGRACVGACMCACVRASVRLRVHA